MHNSVGRVALHATLTCCPPSAATLICTLGTRAESFRTRSNDSHALLNLFCAAVSRLNDFEPSPDPDLQESGGRFRKGFDPRRHTFTAEQRSAGFWAGLTS